MPIEICTKPNVLLSPCTFYICKDQMIHLNYKKKNIYIGHISLAVRFQKNCKNWLVLIGFVCDVIGSNVERSFYHLSNFSFSQHSLNETDETSDTFLQNYPKSNFTHCQSWHALPSVRLTVRGIALLMKIIVINHKKADLFVMLNIILQSPSMYLHIHPYRCTNISFCSSTH